MSMPPDDDVKDLFQRVALIERDLPSLRNKIDQHEGLISAMQMKDAVNDVHNKNIIMRLDKIEGTLVWLNRIVLGGIIAGIVTFLISGGFVR